MTITFFLPWPDSKLSPNARLHWAKKAKAAKKARQSAYVHALEAKAVRLDADRLNVSLTFHAPDKRRRDTDNAISSMKNALDGIAQATGIDDSKWQLAFRWGDPVPGGAVKVELEAA